MTPAKFRFRLTILFTHVDIYFKTKIYINEKKIYPMQKSYALGLISADSFAFFPPVKSFVNFQCHAVLKFRILSADRIGLLSLF